MEMDQAILIAGSRDLQDEELIRHVMRRAWRTFDGWTLVIEGGAYGVDQIAGHISRQAGIDTRTVKAKWNEHGKKAGYVRNALMVTMADVVLCIWDGRSKGTHHTIQLAVEAGLPTIVVIARGRAIWQVIKHNMEETG